LSASFPMRKQSRRAKAADHRNVTSFLTIA
jgi:hypothetical protein